MEGSETSSYQSQENSLLDIPCTLNADDFLLNPSMGRNSELSSTVNAFVSLAPTDSQTAILADQAVGANESMWPRLCEKNKPSSCVNTELFQPSELPWTNEEEDEGELAIRKSLDAFYQTCCKKKPFGGSPAYNAASQCLCVKIADLANKEGTKYAQKSLQIAQMVLNQDGDKIFPRSSSSTCFSAPTKPGVSLEPGKSMPGLSDDILQLILQQDVKK
ncbi:shieldin complex subunit 1 isoform X2 [Tiliqua scincoides]